MKRVKSVSTHNKNIKQLPFEIFFLTLGVVIIQLVMLIRITF